MNRWAERHREELERELEPDETLLDAVRVVITAASSINPTTDLGGADADRNARWMRTRSDRLRRGAARGRGSRAARVAVARELGFPIPGAVFVLGVTNQRAMFWRASPGLASPRALEGTFPLDEVAALSFVRRLAMTRMAVVLEAGPMLVVQPLWSRTLAGLASAFDGTRATS